MSEHETLAAALVAALSELTNVAKRNQANTGSYGYSFANIADVVDETRPVLADHGLVALTSIHGYENRLACTVEIVHTSGETKRFDPLPFPEGRDAQSSGSWMTYMRRYALLAALGMGTEDDDGKGAAAAPRRQERAPEPVSGLSSAEAGEKVRETLEAEGVKADEVVGHAKQVWRDVKPKAVDGVVPDVEVERLVAGAKQYAADLLAMAGSDA